MSGTRILYVTSEIEPFLKITDVADFIRKLPQVMQEKGMEIRILMPRFGIINERKNRLHEVVRLSGTNIPVGIDEHPLIIKVASIPTAKLQVYFIDNEDYFKRKTIFHDKDENWCVDNDERAIFFCKGVIETIKKLGWAPDIVHCNDWMTALIPFYLKTIYKEEPMFKDSKTVFSIHDFQFNNVQKNELTQASLKSDLDEDNLSLFSTGYNGFLKLGALHSDLVIDSTNDSKGLNAIFVDNPVSTQIMNKEDAEIDSYFDMYTVLLENKELV
jgi:starch synthase